jgi:hypothetical protein
MYCHGVKEKAMPQVTVFYKGKKIDQLQFTEHFFVDVSVEEPAVYWGTRDSDEWRAAKEQTIPYDQATHPHIHVWLQGSLASKHYSLPLLRHDWVLEIAGQTCPEGFYDSINITWRDISLTYQDYRFEFVFEYLKTSDKIVLPVPLKDKNEMVEGLKKVKRTRNQ